MPTDGTLFLGKSLRTAFWERLAYNKAAQRIYLKTSSIC